MALIYTFLWIRSWVDPVNGYRYHNHISLYAATLLFVNLMQQHPGFFLSDKRHPLHWQNGALWCVHVIIWRINCQCPYFRKEYNFPESHGVEYGLSGSIPPHAISFATILRTSAPPNIYYSVGQCPLVWHCCSDSDSPASRNPSRCWTFPAPSSDAASPSASYPYLLLSARNSGPDGTDREKNSFLSVNCFPIRLLCY